MKYSLLKRISAFVLAFALVMTTAFNAVGTTQANAAKKATVSAKGATVTVGASKNIKVSIKCKAKAKATIKVAVVKGATGKVTKKVTNSNAKKAAKTCKSTIKVTGKKAGKVKLSITPYINGKKAGKAKKITVTVKAAPATTTEAATTTEVATTTQAVPSVESLDVTASNGTTIGETEQTTLSVASGTQGGVIIADSITFESKNPAILSVDAKGVVTGLKAGQANVLVSAKDSTGKTITAEVAITVTELADATITVPEAQKSLTILVGKSVKLTPSVNPATYADKLIYESSKPELVEVSGDGTVTAKAAADEVTITIKAKGTKGNASVKVKSVANGYGIASFEAIKADTFGVKLTTPVSTADFSKLKFAVKLTSDVTVVPSMDAKGNITLKATNGTLEKGTYTLTLSSESLVLDETTKTASAVVLERAAKAVKITNQRVYAPSNTIKVEYEVDDQYGDKMDGYTADKLTWTLAYKDSTINTSDAIGTYSTTNPVLATNGKYNDGFINLDIGTFGRVNLSAFFTANPTGQADFTITAYVIGAQTVNGSSTLGVKKLKIDKVAILGLASSEAAVPNKNVLRKATATDATYFLKLSGSDENGAPVDWKSYQNGGYSNNVVISANNAALCSLYTEGTATNGDYAHYNGTSNGAGGWTFAPTKTYDGNFPVVIKKNQVGKVTFSAIASVDKVTNESNDSWELEVKDNPKASYIVWPSNVSCALGGSTNVDLKFLDQDKVAVADPKDLTGFTVNVVLGGTDVTNGGGKGDTIPTGLTYDAAKGKYVLHINADRTGTSASVVINNGTYISDNGAINVTSAAAATKFVTNAKTDYSIIKKEEFTFDVWATDQYDALWTGPIWYSLDFTGDTGAIKKNDDSVIGDVAITNSSETSVAVVGLLPDGPGKGARGIRVTLHGGAKGVGKIAVKLYSANNATKTVGAATNVTVNTGDTPVWFAGEVTNTDKTVTAGENINIKLTAKDSTTGNVDTFNGTADVTIIEHSGANKAASYNGASFTGTVMSTVKATFRNGVATVSMPTKLASIDPSNSRYSAYSCYVKLGNNKYYGGKASATEKNDSTGVDADDSIVLSGVTVKAGAPAKFANATVTSGNPLVFGLVDSCGNKISMKDRDIRISAVDENGQEVNKSDILASGVDANNGKVAFAYSSAGDVVATAANVAIISGGKITLTDQASGKSTTFTIG